MKKERFTYLFEALMFEKNAESIPLLVSRFLQSQSEESQLDTLMLLDRTAHGGEVKELCKELEIKISAMHDQGKKRQAVSILQDLQVREEYYQFRASHQEYDAMMTQFSRLPLDKQMALNFQAIMREPWVDGLFSGEIAKHGSQILPHLITALLLDDEVSQKSRCILNILQHMAWSGYLCNRSDILDIINMRVKLASSSRKESLERYHSSIVDAINRKCSPMSRAANN
jgi:hypothetical protein